jgi:hypothetical protein
VENEIRFFVVTVNEVKQIVSNNRNQEIEDNQEIRKQGVWENSGEI